MEYFTPPSTLGHPSFDASAVGHPSAPDTGADIVPPAFITSQSAAGNLQPSVNDIENALNISFEQHQHGLSEADVGKCDASLTHPAGHHGVRSLIPDSETVKPITASPSCGGLRNGLNPDPGIDNTPLV